jgi:hypothetical protein
MTPRLERKTQRDRRLLRPSKKRPLGDIHPVFVDEAFHRRPKNSGELRGSCVIAQIVFFVRAREIGNAVCTYLEGVVADKVGGTVQMCAEDAVLIASSRLLRLVLDELIEWPPATTKAIYDRTIRVFLGDGCTRSLRGGRFGLHAGQPWRTLAAPLACTARAIADRLSRTSIQSRGSCLCNFVD